MYTIRGVCTCEMQSLSAWGLQQDFWRWQLRVCHTHRLRTDPGYKVLICERNQRHTAGSLSYLNRKSGQAVSYLLRGLKHPCYHKWSGSACKSWICSRNSELFSFLSLPLRCAKLCCLQPAHVEAKELWYYIVDFLSISNRTRNVVSATKEPEENRLSCFLGRISLRHLSTGERILPSDSPSLLKGICILTFIKIPSPWTQWKTNPPPPVPARRQTAPDASLSGSPQCCSLSSSLPPSNRRGGVDLLTNFNQIWKRDVLTN